MKSRRDGGAVKGRGGERTDVWMSLSRDSSPPPACRQPRGNTWAAESDNRRLSGLTCSIGAGGGGAEEGWGGEERVQRYG
jgi:hypothetical protein